MASIDPVFKKVTKVLQFFKAKPYNKCSGKFLPVPYLEFTLTQGKVTQAVLKSKLDGNLVLKDIYVSTLQFNS